MTEAMKCGKKTTARKSHLMSRGKKKPSEDRLTHEEEVHRVFSGHGAIDNAFFSTIYWVWPPPSKSHHQDYEPFLVGDPYKPSFHAVTVRGPHPN